MRPKMSTIQNKAITKINPSLKKIDSPLAKYNSSGQLMCIVCNLVVKSEMVWTAHVSGRQHRENVNSLKQAKGSSSININVDNQSLKRKSELGSVISPEAAPSPLKRGIPNDFFDQNPSYQNGLKEIKGILKNSSKPKIPPVEHVMEVDDAPSQSDNLSTQISDTISTSSTIPQGFFDDPKLDAKVRNKEYKDPVEEEWNRFQKEISEEVTTSVSLQEEDQEEATVERQLEEIEEQMLRWNKVLELEQKREVCAQKLQALREDLPTSKGSISSDEDYEEDDLNRLYNWRSKGT